MLCSHSSWLASKCLKSSINVFRSAVMANNSTQFPYRACLIQNLPVETQNQLRDFTNYGVRPLGMLLAIMGFVCNALVVFTVTRTKSLQHPSLLMLCSLSVTDLIYSSYSLYRDVDVLAHEHMWWVIHHSKYFR